jgi:MSHA biogenesis protein MshN
MSVINQMLKDLESRENPPTPSLELLDGQPVNSRGGAKRQPLVLAALLLLLPLLAFLGWEFSDSSPSVQAAPPPLSVATSQTSAAAGEEKLAAEAPATAGTRPAAAPAQRPLVAPASSPAPMAPPRLLSLTPQRLTGSWTAQRLTLKGQNLRPDSRVAVAWDEQRKLIPPERIHYRDSTTLEVEIVTGTKPNRWTVSLLDGQDEPLPLTVTAPEKVAPVTPQAKVTQAGKEAAAPEAGIEKHIRPLRPQQLAELSYKEGYLQLQRGDRESAEATWRRALKQDPDHIASREGLAGLYLSQGRNVEAGTLLAEGLAHHPGHGRFALLSARLQLENGQAQDALTTLEKALATQPQDADFLAFLAALYQREKAFDKSVSAYQRALTLQPRNALWWMGIGISLEGAGKAQEAISAYHEAQNSGKLTPRLARYVEGRLAALE